MWKLQTIQGEDIFNLIQRNTNEMRRRDKEGVGKTTSVDSPPDLPTRNYDQGTYVGIVTDAKKGEKPAMPVSSHDEKKADKKEKKGFFSRKKKDKDEKAPPIPNSTYANVDESPYENESAPPVSPHSRAEYSEPLPVAVAAAALKPEPTYAEPDMPTGQKMSDVVAQIKKQDKVSSNARVPEGMQEYDHIVLSQQRSAPLPPGATGNTYDRLDEMNANQFNDGTYSEIPQMRPSKT